MCYVFGIIQQMQTFSLNILNHWFEMRQTITLIIDVIGKIDIMCYILHIEEGIEFSVLIIILSSYEYVPCANNL